MLPQILLIKGRTPVNSSKKPYIAISDGFDKDLFNTFVHDSNFQVHPKAKMTQDELQEILPEISAIIIRSATKINANLLEKAPNLQYVIRAGEGTDNIDKQLCQKKGVKISNTPGANNNSAAEHAIALMLACLRKIPAANSSMSQGKWEKPLFTGNELSNKTVGIVGFGRIGQLVAKRLQGFETKTLFFDPHHQQSSEFGASGVKSLEELLKQSDLVSIHVPLNDSTKNLFNKERLMQMKKGSILVNAARGKIIEESALVATLKAGHLGAAALDVFSNEPLEENSSLRGLDNLILTPHLGGSTEEAQFRVGEMAIHQIKEFFLNQNLLNEVKA